MNAKDVNIKNRRATFDYAIVETFTAGIVLTGTEIKSLRQGKASLVDTFCYVDRGEVWVKNMYIAEYFFGSYNNHSARRDRKLLLQRKEIRRLGKERQGSRLHHRAPAPLRQRPRPRQARHRPRTRQKGVRQAPKHT